MSHLTSYIGSVILAGLLLQGCGGDSANKQVENNSGLTAVQKFDTVSEVLSSSTIDADTKKQAESDLTLKIASLDATDSDVKKFIDKIMTENNITNRLDAYKAIAESMTTQTAPAKSSALNASILSPITNKIGDALVGALDTKVGNAVTGAAFDVVLNSDGITVTMIDMARKSETTSEIMVDSIEAKWELTEKMCPMLQENPEFGEKFTALAEERDIVGRFFFERIDANMYNCLADAMLLSNADDERGDYEDEKAVQHSTNGYMGVMMARYAADYFIQPTGSTEDRRADKFVSLLLDTGKPVSYDAATRTFENHGDGNELINEKLFYSLFKTPTSTASFIEAMKKIDPAVKTMLMDNIFLGTQADAEPDTIQGYLNIIAIGSAMYEGISDPKFGFSKYTGSFIDFALLIPSDRYITYGKAFINAGYQYAAFHGIDVWDGISETVKMAWNTYNGDATPSNGPSNSAGLGVLGSEWYDDTLDLFAQAWSNVMSDWTFGELYDSFSAEDFSILDAVTDRAAIAYHTVLDGNVSGTTYPTELSNGVHINQDVLGYHGLIELAIQEDIYTVECGNRPFTAAGNLYTADCDNNDSYTMDNAKAAFVLPPFEDLTWSFAYTAATDGAMSYYDKKVNAAWLADLSSNDLIREYFYPDADNIYIPRWLLAIDWLKAADNFNNAEIAATDLNYNAGYFDIYVASVNPTLLTTTTEPVVNGDVDLAQIASLVKTIEIDRVDMNDDNIIAVDENGTTLDGLYVYKVRTVSPEDTQAVLTYLSDLGTDALSAIGLDSSNAANVDTTDANATN